MVKRSSVYITERLFYSFTFFFQEASSYGCEESKRLSDNDLYLLDSIMAGFEKWPRHRLGDSVSIDGPAAKIVDSGIFDV